MTPEKIMAATTKRLNFFFSTRSLERETSYKAFKTFTSLGGLKMLKGHLPMIIYQQ